MSAPIDLNEIARALKDARAIAAPPLRHRQQRPDGTWQPSPAEMRITLVMVIVVVFVLFWVVPR